MILFEAIALRKTVTATYNRGGVTLAPHILYIRNDALHVDAITVDRDGQRPREEKIGTFKVDGLGSLALGPEVFEVSALFDPRDAKYAGAALLTVESGAVPA